MINFISMTLSFTVAILLASGLSLFIVTNKRVMKWYMRKVNKMTEDLFSQSFDREDETV